VADAYWSNVVLLLHLDGSDGSTTFTDAKNGRTVTGNGSPALGTAQSKFGGASLNLASGTKRLEMADNADWTPGASGPYCVEAWHRPSSVSSTNQIIAQWDNGGARSWWLGYTSNKARLYIYIGSTPQSILGTTTVTTDTWHHVAWTWDGTTYRLFLDGNLEGSYSSSTAPDASASKLEIGNSNGSFQGNGWVDEVRITKGGTARYTASFTAPTAAFDEGNPGGDTLTETVSLIAGTVEQIGGQTLTETYSLIAGIVQDSYPSGASGIYALRKVGGSYSGYAGQCIRLRRSSDSVESDFGFSGSNLDTAAIASWLSGATGYVKTVYDQSGNSRNLTQTTTGSQPTYVANIGNGKPGIQFASGKSMTSGTGRSTMLGSGAYTTFAAWRATSITLNTSAWSNHAVWEDSNGYVGEMLRVASSVNYAGHYVYTGTNMVEKTISVGTTYVTICRADASNKYYKIDTASESSASGGYTGSGGNIGVGQIYSASLIGYLHELAFYPSALGSTDKTNTESALVSYWKPAAATYDESRTESATASESLTATSSLVAVRSEAATAAESLGVASTLVATRTEAATAAESLALTAVMSIGLTESVTAGESVVPGNVITLTLSEAASPADSLDVGNVLALTLDEAAASAESVAAERLVYATLSEDAAADESTADQLTAAAALTEPVTADESTAAVTTFGPTLTEAVTAADDLALTAVMGIGLTEAVTADASLSPELVIGLALTEAATAGATETPGLVITLTLDESVTAAETLAATSEFNPVLTEDLTAADSLATQLDAVVSLTEAVTPADEVRGYPIYQTLAEAEEGAERAEELRTATRPADTEMTVMPASGMERPAEYRDAEVQPGPDTDRPEEDRGMTK